MLELSRVPFVKPLKRALKPILDALGLSAWATDIRNRIGYLRRPRIRKQNRRFYKRGAPDGLPLPPAHLVYEVLGRFEVELYCEQSTTSAWWIQEFLRENELEISSFGSMLDFGCGCGRIMRQWHALHGCHRHGVDRNRKLVRWCQRALPFATFHQNKLNTPLDFKDGTFAFIYAISVFTHLDEDGQRFWMDELTRILKPGGYLLISVHGKSRMHEISPEEQQRFRAGELVVARSRYTGHNLCSAYHPETYLQEKLCTGLDTIDFSSGGAVDVNQDAVLLQKPRTPRQEDKEYHDAF